MRIAIIGSTGLIGTALTRYFTQKGDQVVPIGRPLLQEERAVELRQLLEVCETVINVSGAPINKRWTNKYKQELIRSRIEVTRRLVSAIQGLEVKPRVFVSCSAIGYYPANGCYQESDTISGTGFLADLCRRWELEARKIDPAVRLIIPRFGLILSKEGGALPRMLKSVRLGFVVIPGTGKQSFGWLSLKDLCRSLDFLIQKKDIEGVVNLVAPQQLSFESFAEELVQHFHCIAKLKVPEFILRAIMGEAATVLTRGAVILPKKLLEAGFVYQHPSLQQFMNEESPIA